MKRWFVGILQEEWRAIGVQQSRGWVHYAIHRPEPHIMLFKRPLNYEQNQKQEKNGLKGWIPQILDVIFNDYRKTVHVLLGIRLCTRLLGVYAQHPVLLLSTVHFLCSLELVILSVLFQCFLFFFINTKGCEFTNLRTLHISLLSIEERWYLL